MLGHDSLGRLALGEMPNVHIMFFGVSLSAVAALTGVATSNYKQILSETKRRLIYTAEISPWTLSE